MLDISRMFSATTDMRDIWSTAQSPGVSYTMFFISPYKKKPIWDKCGERCRKKNRSADPFIHHQCFCLGKHTQYLQNVQGIRQVTLSCNIRHAGACEILNYLVIPPVTAPGCSSISCREASSTTSVRADRMDMDGSGGFNVDLHFLSSTFENIWDFLNTLIFEECLSETDTLLLVKLKNKSIKFCVT